LQNLHLVFIQLLTSHISVQRNDNSVTSFRVNLFILMLDTT
jgi:hypothetical protein